MEGSQEIAFPKENMMHGKLFSPRFQSGSWLYGLSPISVAAEIISASNDSTQAMASSFKNMGPPYIISSSISEGLTPVQQEMLESVYKKKYGGPEHAGQPMLTGTPVKVEKLGVSPVDLQIIEGSNHALRVLCNVYGVSSVLFNDNDQSTYNNVKQARADFFQYTVQPLNEQFSAKLKRFLIPDEDLWFKFDYSDIEVLQEAMYTKSQALVNSWWLTPNEKRKAIGLAPMDDPLMDEIYKPFGSTTLENASGNEQVTGMDPEKLTEQMQRTNGKNIHTQVNGR
jgi:HK97 family phage portal protein